MSSECQNLNACDRRSVTEWGEVTRQVGNMTGVVARYKHIPQVLQAESNQLIARVYREKLLNQALYQAVLELLASGTLDTYRHFQDRAQDALDAYSPDAELQGAQEYFTRREPEDIVVLVLRQDRVIGTMTLYYVQRYEEIPSLQYVHVSPDDLPPFDQGIELGRLVKELDEGWVVGPRGEMCSIVTFLVANDYIVRNNLLPGRKDILCGTTHAALLKRLENLGFPIFIVSSPINNNIWSNKVNPAISHFLTREVLVQCSPQCIERAIEQIAWNNKYTAKKIRTLLAQGLHQIGLSNIRDFCPEKFQVHFFFFPYHHRQTEATFHRLERIARRFSRGLPERAM